MKPTAQTAGIALSALLSLVAVGTVAHFMMWTGAYLFMGVLGVQEAWQASASVAVIWFVTLAPIIATVCVVARAVARRGGSVAGIMLGVAAYPALCIALVTLGPESWMEVRWAGFYHAWVAAPVAFVIAVVWPFIRPARPMWGGQRSAWSTGSPVSNEPVR